MIEGQGFRPTRLALRCLAAAGIALLLQGAGYPPGTLLDPDGIPTLDPSIPPVDALGNTSTSLASSDSMALTDSSATSLAAASLPTTVAAGRTPVTFIVNNSGAATYTIPLWTPPGVGAVQLSLSLTYSSRGPDGTLGVGWSLAGMSAITRCNKTWAQDGAPAGVTNTTADRFCLDGQQLKLTSAAGTYGQVNSTYATERESFLRIVASSTATGNGPTSFSVITKNGLIYDYGTTTDSRIFAGSSGTVRTWALSAIRDRVGTAISSSNHISFTYYNDAQSGSYTNGSYRIKEIDYPYTATGQGPFYQVVFGYSTRPSFATVSGFLSGYVVNEPNELDTITVQTAAATVIKTYNLAYQQGTATNRLRLSSVKECSTSNCFAPTTISYQDGSQGWPTSTTLIGQSIASASAMIPVDLNGDGITDLVYPVASGANWNWYVRYGSTTGTFLSAVSTGVTTVANQMFVPGAFSGKGRTELLYAATDGYWWRLYWTGTALATASTGAPVTTSVGPSGAATAADVDGDGLPDLVFPVNAADGNGVRSRLYVQRNTTPPGGAVSFAAPTPAFSLPINSNGSSWNFDNQSTSPYFGDAITVADFNGDGRADVLVKIQNITTSGTTFTWTWLMSNGVTFTQGPQFTAVQSSLNQRLIDWNGDGCTDVANPGAIVGSTWKISLSDCSSAGGIGSTIDTGIPSSQIVMAVDWDGDGRQDLLAANGTTWKVVRSTGSGAITTQVDTGITIGVKAWIVGDFNGDGLSDLLASDQSSGNAVSQTLHNGFATPADLATTFTDGFGITQTPTYSPLTASTNIYQKCDGTVCQTASFPEVDFIGPLYVVSNVSGADGTGHSYQHIFSYYGATIHQQGRGFEGFLKRRVLELPYNISTPLVTYDVLQRAFPYTGMLTERDVYQKGISNSPPDGTVVSVWVGTPNYQTLGSGYETRTFPFVSVATDSRYEYPSGSPSTQSVTNLTYGDTYGNPTVVSTVVTDEDSSSPFYGSNWTSTTSTTFNNDNSANWCLGLPAVTTIDNSLPGQVTPTRRTYNYGLDSANPTTCRIKTQIIEPSTPNQTVTTDLGFDGCGNASSVTVTAANPAGYSPATFSRQTSYNYSYTTPARCQFPETVTDALSQVTTIAYNYNFGVPISETDPNGIATSWAQDDFGRMQRENRPDGTYTTRTYSSCSSSNNYCSTAATDVKLALQDSEFPSGGGGSFTQGTRSFDAFDRLRFDQSYRLGGIWTTNAAIQYDALGRRSREDRPYSSSSNGYATWTYDGLDRVTFYRLYQSGGTLDRTTQVAYSGRTTSVTDPLSHTTTNTTDVVGQLRRVRAPGALTGCYPSGSSLCYDYDAFGNLTNVTDPIGAVSSGTYNLRGFRTTWSDADRGVWTFEGNSLNELVHVRDAITQSPLWTQEIGYDSLGRMTSRLESEGQSNWVWGQLSDNDATHKYIGRLKSLTGFGYSEILYYDSIGRLSTRSITSDQPYQYDFTYNSIGAVDTITYPTSPIPTGQTGSRLKIQYGYSYGQQNSIVDITNTPAVTLWTLNTTNDYSSALTETLGTTPTATTVTSTYKPWTNEISSIQSGVGAGLQTNRQNLGYLWDVAGNLTQRGDANQTGTCTVNGASGKLCESFLYDPLDRLTTSSLNGSPNLTVGYDLAGNISSKSDVGSSPGTYTYGDSSHPHGVTYAGGNGVTGGTALTYDHNGNVLTRGGVSQTWYSYNLPSSLQATISGTTYSSQFWYGPEHQRWRQISTYANGAETTLYAGDLLEKITGPTGPTFWRHYVHTPSGLSVVVSRNSDFSYREYFDLSDHLDSSDAILNSDGSLAVQESFRPFGARRGAGWSAVPTSADYTAISQTTRHGFTFHEHLDNLGLIHANGRAYDPVIGRFMSVDPIIGDPRDAQYVNPYAYVGSRPLNAVDPTGNFAIVFSFSGSTVADSVEFNLGPIGLMAMVIQWGMNSYVPQPPTASVLPGTSAQSANTPCGAGGFVGQCTGGGIYPGATPGFNPLGLNGNPRSADPSPPAPDLSHTLSSIAIDIAISFIPYVGQTKGVYDAYKVFQDPNATALDKAAAAIGVLPGGKLVGAAGKLFRVAARAANEFRVGAKSVNAADALTRKLSALEKAQAGAARTRSLPDGRMRYYGPETTAGTAGATRGASLVTEYNPRTGQVRQWMESYDHAGTVTRVHPKMIDGQIVDSLHYPPTGTELAR